MSRRIPVALAGGALALAVAACGGEGDRDPEAWVADACTTMATWTERTDRAEEALADALALAETPIQGRAAVLAFVERGAINAAEAQRRLDAAGAPDLGDGEKIADSLTELVAGIRESFEERVGRARRLPLSDWDAFSTAGARLVSEAELEADKLGEELAETEVSSGSELPHLLRTTSACVHAEAAADALAENRARRAATILEDDFSSPRCDFDWRTRQSSTRRATHDCVDGVYRIFLRDPTSHQFGVVTLPDAQPAMSVDVDALPAEAATTSYGVGCWDANDRGYLFYVVGDRRYAILEESESVVTTTLKKGRLPDGVLNAGEANHIRGECDARPIGSTVLTLIVNDRQVTRVGPDGLEEFSAGGFAMTTDRAPASTDFDDLVLGVP